MSRTLAKLFVPNSPGVFEKHENLFVAFYAISQPHGFYGISSQRRVSAGENARFAAADSVTSSLLSVILVTV